MIEECKKHMPFSDAVIKKMNMSNKGIKAEVTTCNRCKKYIVTQK